MLDFDKVIDIAKDVMEQTGRHKPQIIFFHKDKVELKLLIFDDNSKPQLLANLRDKIRIENIPKYILIFESWMGNNLNRNAIDDENHKEVLLIHEFTNTLKNRVVIIPFTKTDTGINWEPVQELPAKDILTQWNFYLEDAFAEHLEQIRKK